jgi:hypothetical protein
VSAAEAEKSGRFVVGEESDFVVGLRGTVTAKGDGTVTIDGVTVPTRLTGKAGPVRYLSNQLPGESEPLRTRADHSQCHLDAEETREAAEREMFRLADAVRALHDENHDGPFSVCIHAVCRTVRA